jgi:hypothetical protein
MQGVPMKILFREDAAQPFEEGSHNSMDKAIQCDLLGAPPLALLRKGAPKLESFEAVEPSGLTHWPPGFFTDSWAGGARQQLGQRKAAGLPGVSPARSPMADSTPSTEWMSQADSDGSERKSPVAATVRPPPGLLPGKQQTKAKVQGSPPASPQRKQDFNQPVGNHHAHFDPSFVDHRQSREWRTTLLVRNLPCYYTQTSLMSLMDELGLEGQYDFVYAPMDFKSKRSMGYAFVNFRGVAATLFFRKAMDGFSRWPIRSQKVCSVVWSETQGLEANIDVVLKSDMMRKAAAPEEFKPLVLLNGQMVHLSSLVANGGGGGRGGRDRGGH